MVKRDSEDSKFYLSEVYKFVRSKPVVGEAVVADFCSKFHLDDWETYKLLRLLLLGGFIYCPIPHVYSDYLEAPA